MIVTLGGIVSSVHGSVGGATFSSSATKTVVSKKKTTPKKSTKKSKRKKSIATTAPGAYKSVSAAWWKLLGSDRTAWNNAAATAGTPMGGATTGKALFTKYYFKASAMGIDFPELPPSGSYSRSTSDIDAVACSTLLDTVNCHLNFTGAGTLTFIITVLWYDGGPASFPGLVWDPITAHLYVTTNASAFYDLTATLKAYYLFNDLSGSGYAASVEEIVTSNPGGANNYPIVWYPTKTYITSGVIDPVGNGWAVGYF